MRTSTLAPTKDHVWISERFQILVRSIDVVVTATGPTTARMICPTWEDYARGMSRADAAIWMLKVPVKKIENGRIQVVDFVFSPEPRTRGGR